MKKEDFLKRIKKLDISQIRDSRPLSKVIEEEANNFLKTRKGLQYLCTRYPNLSLLNAVREYKANVWQANNY